MSTIGTTQCEIIYFRRGDSCASIATNGTRHVSQETIIDEIREHKSLMAAIAYLEARGWSIDTERTKPF